MWQTQTIEKKSFKNLRNKKFLELGEIGYCYWDEKLVLPLSLLPHVIPISKSVKEVPSFQDPEKTTVSFFVRMFCYQFFSFYLFQEGWLEEWQSVFAAVLSRHQFSICRVFVSLDHAHSNFGSTQFEKLLIDCMECEEFPHPQVFEFDSLSFIL